MDKTEVGEFVTYIDYNLKARGIMFSLQQRLEDGEKAYKNTSRRFPEGIENSLNGIP